MSYISLTHSSKSKCYFKAKPSAYYFYVKTKITADFQICISVPLTLNTCTEAVARRCSIKGFVSGRIGKIHRKTPVPEPLFWWSCRPQPAALLKRRLWHRPATFKKDILAQVFSHELCQILKEAFFYRTAPSGCVCMQHIYWMFLFWQCSCLLGWLNQYCGNDRKLNSRHCVKYRNFT